MAVGTLGLNIDGINGILSLCIVFMCERVSMLDQKLTVDSQYWRLFMGSMYHENNLEVD